MKKFILIILLCIPFAGNAQMLKKPIVIQSKSMDLVELESLSEPMTHTVFTPQNQDQIIFNGERISEVSTVNGDSVNIFDFAVSSYKSFQSPDEPDLVYYSIYPQPELSCDIMQIVVNTNTKHCQFKTFRRDDTTNDIWLIISIAGTLK